MPASLQALDTVRPIRGGIERRVRELPDTLPLKPTVNEQEQEDDHQ